MVGGNGGSVGMAGGLAWGPKQLAGRVGEMRRRRTAPLILELDLTLDLVEAPPQDPVSAISQRRKARLGEVLDALRRARSDAQVALLVVKVGGAAVGLARAQELRDAVLAFRAEGKTAIAWAESFGEFGPGNTDYYLATAFDQVYLQPSGAVGLTGVSIEQRFVKETLDRLGVTPEVARRHEYKSAPDTFVERQFTPAPKEAAERLVTSTSEQLVSGIALGRGLSEDKVAGLVHRAPLLAREALDEGLVDELAYRDQVYDRARERAGKDARLLFLTRYERGHVRKEVTRKLDPRGGQAIGLVYGIGPIQMGRSGRSPLQGQSAGSDSVSAALRAAVADEHVKAIVFRVHSPGGSYVASDTIWREVVRAREAGKPVIVSMGDVAGSGGYFVAMAADAIVAEPGTLTGSIGVFAGKPVLSDALSRLGVTHDSVQQGEHARMFSTVRGFSDGEWERLNSWLDHVYDDFTAKAAEGRNLSRERVHEVARGRVWTGADARGVGLVDELGGLDRAVELARTHAGIPEGDRADVQVYPKVSPLERLRHQPESSEDPTAAGTQLRLEAWGSLETLATRLGLPAGGPLMLPGPWKLD